MLVTRKNKIRVLFILFAVVVPVVNWFIFYIYANIEAILMAFQDVNGNWTLRNFTRFFGEFTMETSDIKLALTNTFLTFAILFITYPFKVLVSYFIYKKVPGASFYRIVFFIPSILFSICTVMMFSRIVGVNGFIAKAIQEAKGLEYVPELLGHSDYANTVVLCHLLWLGFPGDLIVWGGTFARIPVEVLESGELDGTSWWTEFTKIIVPMVWPTVALQMVLLFCGIFGASGAVFLLTGGGYGTMTLNAWMYIELYENSGAGYASGAHNYLSAVGMMMTIVAVCISLGIRKITDKMFDEVEF